MSDWTKIPAGAAQDEGLQDGELRTLARISALAWEVAGEPRTPALHWYEFVDLLGISKATYFRHIRILERSGYLDIAKSLDRVRFSILTRETVRPTATRDSLNLLEEEEVKTSSKSHSLTRENELIIEILKSAGIGDPLRSQLAQDDQVKPKWIQGHIRLAELQGSPRRLLAHRLKSRDPLPSEELAELEFNRAVSEDFWTR